MGWHLDGRAGAVVGTHTHVPTADARVLPQGTAYISDVGMTGSRASVLGVRWEQALEGFRTQMPVRFTTAEDDVWVNAVLVEHRARRARAVDRAGARAGSRLVGPRAAPAGPRPPARSPAGPKNHGM